jgi:hypothetical protein
VAYEKGETYILLYCKVLENNYLGRIAERRREGVAGGHRKLQNK